MGDEGREGGGVGQERPVGLSGLLGCLLGAVLASAAAEQVRVRPLCHIAFLFLQKLAGRRVRFARFRCSAVRVRFSPRVLFT